MALDPKKFVTSTQIDAPKISDFGPTPTDAEIAASRERHRLERERALPYTTQEELDRLSDFGADPEWIRVAKTVDDNARLRALVKRAEYVDHRNEPDRCPWCGADAVGQRYGDDKTKGAHTADCPAFTPAGDVR